jgi:hypothetical protein
MCVLSLNMCPWKLGTYSQSRSWLHGEPSVLTNSSLVLQYICMSRNLCSQITSLYFGLYMLRCSRCACGKDGVDLKKKVNSTQISLQTPSRCWHLSGLEADIEYYTGNRMEWKVCVLWHEILPALQSQVHVNVGLEVLQWLAFTASDTSLPPRFTVCDWRERIINIFESRMKQLVNPIFWLNFIMRGWY